MRCFIVLSKSSKIWWLDGMAHLHLLSIAHCARIKTLTLYFAPSVSASSSRASFIFTPSISAHIFLYIQYHNMVSWCPSKLSPHHCHEQHDLCSELMVCSTLTYSSWNAFWKEKGPVSRFNFTTHSQLLSRTRNTYQPLTPNLLTDWVPLHFKSVLWSGLL